MVRPDKQNVRFAFSADSRVLVRSPSPQVRQDIQPLMRCGAVVGLAKTALCLEGVANVSDAFRFGTC